MRIAASIFILALAGGCAGGLSKEECLYADWRAVGYEDGARGAPASAVSSHRQACAKKAAVTPNMSEYLAGRDAGLLEFCQPTNGFSLGVRGGQYYGVCTGPGEGAFTTAYQQGNQLYTLESDVARTQNALSTAHARLEDVEHKISHAEVALIAPDTPHEDRVHILADLKNLNEEKRRIENSFRPLRFEHERAQEELAYYRAFLATKGPYPGAMNASY